MNLSDKKVGGLRSTASMMALALALIPAAPANAQDQAQPAEQAADPAESQGVAEIVVTAQFR